MMNCKKNISFYKDQMRKNKRNKEFYAEQVAYMERKLEKLQNSVNNSVYALSEKLRGFL